MQVLHKEHLQCGTKKIRSTRESTVQRTQPPQYLKRETIKGMGQNEQDKTNKAEHRSMKAAPTTSKQHRDIHT